MSLIIGKSWPSSCLPLSQSAWLPSPRELFGVTQPTSGSTESRQHLKDFDSSETGFLLFMSFSLFSATCVQLHAPASFGNAVSMTSLCFCARAVKHRQQAPPSLWKAHIVRGESGRAMLTSWGQAANSFRRARLLPRLPSSSTYSSHPLIDPSDHGPVLAPLHPTTRHPSLCERRVRGRGTLGVRSCMSGDESWGNGTMINKRLMWTMIHSRGLPKLLKEPPVKGRRKPIGDDNRGASPSSDHCHVSERGSSKGTQGFRQAQTKLTMVEAAWWKAENIKPIHSQTVFPLPSLSLIFFSLLFTSPVCSSFLPLHPLKLSVSQKPHAADAPPVERE